MWGVGMSKLDGHLNVNVKDSVRISKAKNYAASSVTTSKAPPSEPTRNQDIEKIRLAMQRSKQRVRKKPKTPVKLIVTCIMLLALAIFAHFKHDQIDSLLSRIDIGIFTEGYAQQEKSSTPSTTKGTNVPTDKGVEAVSKSKEKTSWTQEEINIFKGLEDRKKQLDERENNLNAMAEELQKQRLELDTKLAKLEEIRGGISKTLGEQVEKDEEKLAKLVEVYSNMKPNNAAKVFENIDENLAVDILTRMKKDRAANILNLIEPQKARRLSEKFAGYVRK